jgi:hypothetical protein
MPLDLNGSIIQSSLIDGTGTHVTGVVRDGLVLYLDSANQNSYSASRSFVSARVYSTFNGLRASNYSVQGSYVQQQFLWYADGNCHKFI